MPDIRQLYEKDFLGQWDCTDEDLILTIKGVSQEEVVQPKTNKKTKKVCLAFKETDKKMVLNATNRDIIAGLIKTWDYTKWPGVKVQLYKDPKVRFGTEEVGGLRVRKFLPASEPEVFCDECGQEIKASNGMTPKQLAAYTKKKYGKALCPECAKKAKEAQDAAKQQ